jgi:hypothetical protein
MGDQPVAGRRSYAQKKKQNNRTQTYMRRVGFETMIPAFVRAKTVNTLGRAATVIDGRKIYV